jgi:hypothetical protein
MKIIDYWKDYSQPSNNIIDNIFIRRVCLFGCIELHHSVRIVKYSNSYPNSILRGVKSTGDDSKIYLFSNRNPFITEAVYMSQSKFIKYLTRTKYNIKFQLFGKSEAWEYDSIDEVDTDKYPFLLSLPCFRDIKRHQKLEELGI